MEKHGKCTGRDMAGFFLLGLSLIMLGKSLMLCFSNDIWYDELFTVGMVEHSYGALVRFTAADVHPPLYYCIVKLFVDLCKLIAPGAGTVIPAKLVSVLPYFMLLLYAVTFIRKRFGLFTGGLFLFCVTAMPQLPAYTVEVRMYGWALLFVTAAFLHGYALVSGDAGRLSNTGESSESYVNNMAESGEHTPRKGENDGSETDAGAAGKRHARNRFCHGVALVIYGLAAAYTQYFACVAVVMVYLFVLLAFCLWDRKRIREWFFYVAVSVICYVPWLFALAGQLGAVSENYWILPLTWRSLGGCVKFLMKPAFADDRLNMVLAAVLFASYVILWCGWAAKLYHSRRVVRKKAENQIHDVGGECGKGKDNQANKGGRADGAGDENGGMERQSARFLLATAGVGVLAGVVAFGFAASFLLRPVFVYRYMIPALGCFWLGFALCLDNVLCKLTFGRVTENFPGKKESGRHNIGRSRIFRGAGIALTILVVIVGLRDYRAFMGEEQYKIRLMAETEAALSRIGPQDSVLYNFDQVQAVTGYYLQETTARFLWQGEGEKLIQDITSPCGTVEDVEKIREMLAEAEEKDAAVWFIGSFQSRDDIVARWREAGLAVEEQGSFLLERYWFNLYKISSFRT